MLLLLLVDELLLNNVKETGLYLWGSILVLAVMWILLRIEYDALYNTTYQESANLRTEIADILTKLPYLTFPGMTFRIWRKPSWRMWQLLSML